MTSAREGGCHFPLMFKKYVNFLAVPELIRNFAV